MRNQPTIERFFPKINLVSQEGQRDCWDWDGSLSSNGYGLIWHKGHCVRAHRFIYEYLNKTTIPADKEIDHLCRNHKCVNPKHLELVTRRENIMRGKNPEILRQRMLNTDREYFQTIGRLGGMAERKPKRQALKEA